MLNLKEKNQESCWITAWPFPRVASLFLDASRKTAVMANEIRTVSPEPMLLAYVSDMPRGNFSQKSRHVALQRVRTCALKDLFDGKSEELFSRDTAHLSLSCLHKKGEPVVYQSVETIKAVYRCRNFSL